ncbi:MAG TPA: MFS transporter [Tepidisphaeraceae bacterium]|jgi:NNP family nitrate/nitrite transporter-like MFS transporter|nr:MFS transporter [Tepidisphaeraceae bacterium]
MFLRSADYLPPAGDALAPGRWRMLNYAWVSFFLTFVVWYNLGAFSTTIARVLGLTKEQSQVLMLCNLALTIPARVGIGMLVDRFGPRRIFSWLLALACIPCLGVAFSNHFWQLVICRLLISCVGAGFVVGIRMVGEWFDAREIGTAEGIYGGLGNFGMAAATFGLPLLALLFNKDTGWRWATAISGVACLAWAFVFHAKAIDSPAGREFKRPKKRGALEVTSRADLAGLIFLQIPMILCLGITAWRLVRVHFMAAWISYIVYALLAALLVQQIAKILSVNAGIAAGEKPDEEERYSFSQVAILCLCYGVTFGGELAVEQMLPGYFEKMFGVSVAIAGVMGAGFAFANFIARPLGGILGDHLGRKPIMVVTLAGSAAGFFLIRAIGPHWPLWSAMAATVVVGLFLMAGNGANFCIAPLIRKPLTGQIAGLIGAYGSVGSVAFMTILLLTDSRTFFLTMGITGAAAFAGTLLLREPGRKMMIVAMASMQGDEVPVQDEVSAIHA